MLEQEEQKQTILKLVEQRKQTSKSNASVAKNVLNFLTSLDYMSKFEPKESGKSFFDTNDAFISDEAVLVAKIAFRFQEMFDVNELVVVDSQNLTWLKKTNDDDKINDLKPDLFFCKDNLFEACEEYQGDNKYEDMLNYIATKKNKDSKFYYHFGRAIWSLKQLTSVVEVKVQLECQQKNDFIGQIINYINCLSLGDSINAYHGILMDNRSAYLFISYNGVTVKGVNCKLCDLGTNELIKNFIQQPKNYLHFAINTFLKEMQLQLIRGQSTDISTAFLGNGRDGYVFLVRSSGSLNSDDRSSNNSNNSNNKNYPTAMALKILINKTDTFFMQDKRISKLQNYGFTVTVLRSMFIKLDENYSALGYLIKEVGEALSVDAARSDLMNILMFIHEFHDISNEAHGDCRFQNIILYQGKYLFIDLDDMNDKKQPEDDFKDFIQSIYPFADLKFFFSFETANNFNFKTFYEKVQLFILTDKII
jgi:hypothetical protein